jgi:hypothetical protein
VFKAVQEPAYQHMLSQALDQEKALHGHRDAHRPYSGARAHARAAALLR